MDWESYAISGESFHFGRHGAGQEACSVVFPSDSLFAALVYCASLLDSKEDFEAWIEPFRNDDPRFLLTSAFPRAGKIRFFPLPLMHLDKNDRNVLSIKQIKKIAFLSEKLFVHLMNGSSLGELLNHAETLQNGMVLISQEEWEKLPQAVKTSRAVWVEEKRPRVTLDRISSVSAIFFTGIIQFSEDCGLWFAVQNRTGIDADRQKLTRLIAELAVNGLGGERSTGIGHCQIVPAGTISLPESGELRWVTLSRYLPAADEPVKVFSGDASYVMDNLGGWLNSPGKKAERRKNLNMINEGAVLSPCPGNVYGSMVDVQPDYGGSKPVGHPVWRNGYAAAVGIRSKEGGDDDSI